MKSFDGTAPHAIAGKAISHLTDEDCFHLSCSRETDSSGGIAKGFALDDGFPAYRDTIVKAGGLGDATQNRGQGFFVKSTTARCSDS